MMSDKTESNRRRQREFKARRQELGYRELRGIWVHKDHYQRIKEMVIKIANKDK